MVRRGTLDARKQRGLDIVVADDERRGRSCGSVHFFEPALFDQERELTVRRIEQTNAEVRTVLARGVDVTLVDAVVPEPVRAGDEPRSIERRAQPVALSLTEWQRSAV